MNPILIVLDTNVCLDLFVFRDPGIMDFYNAIINRHFHVVTREDCRQEWMRVLEYPKLDLNVSEKEQAKQEFDRLTDVISPDKRDYHLLPLCSDKDDQKFLEIAFDGRVSALFTKDKALLKLARKNARNGSFRILPPGHWKQLV